MTNTMPTISILSVSVVGRDFGVSVIGSGGDLNDGMGIKGSCCARREQ